MNDDQTADDSDPISQLGLPDDLEARTWTSGPRPRLHGYDLHEDLAEHYGFAEITLTALAGEVPTRVDGRLFELALAYLAPCTVAEAATHAVVVARTIAARWPAIVATAAAVLAEQASATIERQRGFLAWLDQPAGPPPVDALCHDEDERGAVRRLTDQVRRHSPPIPALGRDLGLLPALLAIVHHCGLRDPEQLVSVLVLARLPGVLSEAQRPAGQLRAYPMDHPHFDYQPSEEPSA